MTVAELTVLQLYGLFMLAVIMCLLGMFAMQAYKNLVNTRERLMFWACIGICYGLPAAVGFRALVPL